MAPVIALIWLLAMISVFGWLLWWDRTEERDQERRSPPYQTDLDILATRAQNGDEACKRFLWETLIDTNYRDVRSVLDYLQERPRAAPPPDGLRADPVQLGDFSPTAGDDDKDGCVRLSSSASGRLALL
jgi:hypothetical protein